MLRTRNAALEHEVHQLHMSRSRTFLGQHPAQSSFAGRPHPAQYPMYQVVHAQPFSPAAAQPFSAAAAQPFSVAAAQPFSPAAAQPFSPAPAQPFSPAPAQPLVQPTDFAGLRRNPSSLMHASASAPFAPLGGAVAGTMALPTPSDLHVTGRNLPTIAPLGSPRTLAAAASVEADKKPAAAAAAPYEHDETFLEVCQSFVDETDQRKAAETSLEEESGDESAVSMASGVLSALSVEETSARGTDHGEPEGEKEVDGGAAALLPWAARVGPPPPHATASAGYMPPDKSRALPDIKCKRSRTLETIPVIGEHARMLGQFPGTHAAPAAFPGAHAAPAPTALLHMPGPRPGAGPSRKRLARSESIESATNRRG